MALTKTRVTGRLPLPDDQIWLGSYVEFHLSGVDIDKASNDVLMQMPVHFQLDAEGRIDASLWPNTRSEQGTSYNVTAHLMSPVTRRTSPCFLGKIVVPVLVSGAAVDISDLIAMVAPAPDVPDLLAQTLAAAARAVVNADSIDDNAARAAASATEAAGSAGRAADSEGEAKRAAQEAKDIAGSVGVVIATQADAEAGSDNSKLMTPLRSSQAFLKNYNDRLATAAQVIAGTAINLIVTPANLPAWLASRMATRADAEAGTDAEKLITPLRVAQYVNTWFSNQRATQAQAAAGTATDRIMTPLATEQHMMANALGWGQARAAFSADQRPSGTAQVNDTGRPIEITFSLEGGGGGCRVETSSDGTTFAVALRGININGQERLFSSLTVPPGHQYRPHYQTFYSWSELR